MKTRKLNKWIRFKWSVRPRVLFATAALLLLLLFTILLVPVNAAGKQSDWKIGLNAGTSGSYAFGEEDSTLEDFRTDREYFELSLTRIFNYRVALEGKEIDATSDLNFRFGMKNVVNRWFFDDGTVRGFVLNNNPYIGIDYEFIKITFDAYTFSLFLSYEYGILDNMRELSPRGATFPKRVQGSYSNIYFPFVWKYFFMDKWVSTIRLWADNIVNNVTYSDYPSNPKYEVDAVEREYAWNLLLGLEYRMSDDMLVSVSAGSAYGELKGQVGLGYYLQ